MELFFQLSIICPLVFLAGFVDAIAGGGGLISLPAYLIAGLPPHAAIGTNKLSSCMGTSLAAFRFFREGFIPWKLALLCCVSAYIGSTIGARLALLLPDDVFKIVMLFILPLTALYVIFGKGLDNRDRPPFSFRKTVLLGMLIALVIGVYDGFYGPGTGTFLLLLLMGVAHVSLHQANGVTKVINLMTNIAALAVFITSGQTLWLIGLIAGCFNIAGNYWGTKVFVKEGVRSVKPIILIVITIFLIKVIGELFF